MADATSLPLHGVAILVTRRLEQAEGLAARLRALGASIVEVAAIAIAPPEDPEPLDDALRHLDQYHWLVLTSANAVRAVSERLRALGDDAPLPAALAVATVGPATTAAFQAAFPGAHVEAQPASDFRAEGLIEALAHHASDGQRFLLPGSDRAGEILPAALVERGARVDVLVAYRTLAPADLAARVRAAAEGGQDLVTFASPSAVRNLMEAAPDLVGPIPAAVIGPVTERAAREAGLTVAAVAVPSTVEGLVTAVLRCFAGGPPPKPREPRPPLTGAR